MLTDTMTWHHDSHKVAVQLNKSELRILEVFCPHKGKDDSPCRHPDAECVVAYFVQRYGFDCNVGVCQPEPEMSFAWTYVGDMHREIESGQVWIIPEKDEAFAAWMITQASE